MDHHVGDGHRGWEDLDLLKTTGCESVRTALITLPLSKERGAREREREKFWVSTSSSWERSAIPDVKSYVTCANMKRTFAFGRLDLRIHFDLGEPVAVGRKLKWEILKGQRSGATIEFHSSTKGKRPGWNTRSWPSTFRQKKEEIVNSTVNYCSQFSVLPAREVITLMKPPQIELHVTARAGGDGQWRGV